MSHELFLKIIKEEIEVGTSQNVSKLELVENALRQLAILDNDKFNEQIELYRSKKDEIIKEQLGLNDKFNKLVDKYYDALLKGL